MRYAQKNLAPGETIVLRARYHWSIYRVALLLFCLAVLLAGAALYAVRASSDSPVAKPVGWLALLFLALAAVTLAVRWLRARADEFVATNRRVIRKIGVISREIEQAPLEKIQDITVDQGFIGRVLGFGDVSIETASERGTLTFPRIARPDAFRNALWGQVTSPLLPGRSPVAQANLGTPVRQRLAELESLKQQGLLSEEEYASKRREIISGL